MITASLLLSAAWATSATPASEYFPLNAGDEYIYVDETAKQRFTVVDRVSGPVKVKERDAYQIDSYLGDKAFGTTFYYAEAKGVLVAAYEKDKPLTTPFPIFQTPEAGASWVFSGSSVVFSEEVPVALVGQVKKGKPFKYLDQTLDTLEVKITVDDGSMKTEQVCLYAKGIGLVEMKETILINKKKQERSRRLVSYKAAGKRG